MEFLCGIFEGLPLKSLAHLGLIWQEIPGSSDVNGACKHLQSSVNIQRIEFNLK